MLSDSEKDALEAIRLNIDAIHDFIEGLTPESFAVDRLRLYATTRALEIISEASRRLPEDFRLKYPFLDWRAIRDAGNFYRHSYAHVSGTPLATISTSCHRSSRSSCDATSLSMGRRRT